MRKIDKLRNIQERILTLVDEATELLPADMQSAASGYWISHIKGALDKSNFCGGSMIDMESQICRIEEDREGYKEMFEDSNEEDDVCDYCGSELY